MPFLFLLFESTVARPKANGPSSFPFFSFHICVTGAGGAAGAFTVTGSGDELVVVVTTGAGAGAGAGAGVEGSGFVATSSIEGGEGGAFGFGVEVQAATRNMRAKMNLLILRSKHVKLWPANVHFGAS